MNTQKDTSSDEIENLYLEFLEYLDAKPGNDIPGILIDIESKIKALLEGREYLSQKYGENRDSVERKIMHKITGDSVNIGNLLETLAKKVQEILKKSPEEIDREMGIFVRELSGVVLPPGAGNRQEGDGNVGLKEEKELSESRYGKILEILRENEIYADDIIVYKGQLRTSQMRQVSYRVIQIPRLSKTIFVCDEYAEASFVVDSLVYPEVFLEHTKSDIREKLSATRIIHSISWETRIMEAIFGTSEERKVFKTEKTSKKKIDVREMNQFREEILRLFPKADDWMSLISQQRGELRIIGKGLTAISTIFGVFGKPVNVSRDMALLGQKIYGEGHDIIDSKLWTEGRWREEIMKQFPTPEDWMKLVYKEKINLNVSGVGLIGLGTYFGIKGNPLGKVFDMALLGKKIYGEGHDVIDSALWNRERWREEILKKFPTPDSFMQLTQREKGNLKIYGKGVWFLGTLFGVGDPMTNTDTMALLGREIYGDGHDVIDCEFWSQEKWREEIIKIFPTPESWMNLTQKEKLTLKIREKGLNFLARAFKESGLPIGKISDMAQLGQKIYGEGHDVIDCELWNIVKWKEEILKLLPTPEDLMKLTQKQKNSIKIKGKGLRAIGTMFGISGDSASYGPSTAEFGKVIYGKGHEVIDSELWNSEKWKEEILKQFPTPEDLMKLSKIEKREVKIYGKGLKALSTLFGIEGEPIDNNKTMAYFGHEIYGKGYDVFDCEFWNIDRWKEEIIKYYPTIESWMNITQKERSTFKLCGKGFKAIGTIFGIKGVDVRSLKGTALLGEKIYGSSPIFDTYK